MELIGQPERYGVMSGVRLHSLRPNRTAVCSKKSCWERCTKRFLLVWDIQLNDVLRKKLESPMRSTLILSEKGFVETGFFCIGFGEEYKIFNIQSDVDRVAGNAGRKSVINDV